MQTNANMPEIKPKKANETIDAKKLLGELLKFNSFFKLPF